MAYDEDLANRIREQLASEDGRTERAMFGGLAFLLGGNMAVGISSGHDLMVRVGPDAGEEAAARPHARTAVMGARTMKGFVFVDPAGIETDAELGEWVARGVAFARSLPPKGA